MLNGIHHVAYRCHDAKKTIEFYQKHLKMDFVLAISEDKVPSTGEQTPYMHVFLDAGGGNILAFFEIPNSPPMGHDPNTPDWVQHIAFKVKDKKTLISAKENIEQNGVKVIGPTDHGIFHSIYFRDPNGHRLELSYDCSTADQLKKLHDIAPTMINEWSKHKKVQTHASWLHPTKND